MYILTFLLVCGASVKPVSIQTADTQKVRFYEHARFEPIIEGESECFVRQLVVVKYDQA